MSPLLSKAILAVGLLFAGLCGPSVGAQTPLPDDLTVLAWAHTNADVVRFPTSNPTQRIRGDVTFKNAGTSSVRISWRFKTANGSGWKVTKHDVAYKPTSVCIRAGTSDTLYVVGWAERASKVIVEEWKLTGMALGETVLPSGKTKVTLAGPTIDRTVIAATSALPPIACAAANPWSEELYLLDAQSTRSIHVMDLATGELAATPLVTSAQEPALAEHRSLVAGLTDTGFVLFSELRPRWVRPGALPMPQDAVSWVDADLDGQLDSIDVLPIDVFNAVHLNHWVLDYAEP